MAFISYQRGFARETMKAVLVGIAFAIAIVACASLLFSGYNTALAPDRFKGFWED